MALDLGGIISGIAGEYIGARFAQPQSFSLPDWGDIGFTPPASAAASTAAAVPTGMTTAGCPPGYMKRKTRRRRKRLATPSDLKDLAALKGVLGGGEAFKVWIATHS